VLAGKVGHWKKGVTRKEVWGHQERTINGKEGFTWKGGSMIKEGLKKAWLTGKMKVIGKWGLTRKG